MGNGNDLISRADAIEAMIEYWDGYAKPLDSWDVMNQTRAVLETLPSAEATTGDYPNDLISRSALMEYCSNQKSKSIDNNDIARFPSVEAEQTICHIENNTKESDLVYRPSAEAVQGWIPCSERLPSAEDCPMDCMVTRRSKYVGNYTDMAVAEADGTWTHEDWKAITINGNATCISTRDADIIAWMPLPKPYREESEVEE